MTDIARQQDWVALTGNRCHGNGIKNGAFKPQTETIVLPFWRVENREVRTLALELGRFAMLHVTWRLSENQALF